MEYRCNMKLLVISVLVLLSFTEGYYISCTWKADQVSFNLYFWRSILTSFKYFESSPYSTFFDGSCLQNGMLCMRLHRNKNFFFQSVIVRRVMALHAHLNQGFQVYCLNWPTRSEAKFAKMGNCICVLHIINHQFSQELIF